MGERRLFHLSTVVLLVIYYYTWQCRVGVILFKDAAGLWKEDALKPYISSVVNVVVNILLVKLIGINGVFISTIICMVLINAPWETKVLFKNVFKRNIREYVLNQVIFLVTTIVSSFICYYISELVIFGGVLDILYRLVICLIIPNTILIVINHNRPEYNYAKEYAKKYIKF
jgi:hypothetical protein